MNLNDHEAIGVRVCLGWDPSSETRLAQKENAPDGSAEGNRGIGGVWVASDRLGKRRLAGATSSGDDQHPKHAMSARKSGAHARVGSFKAR
jgi:hypothetical protein